MAREALDQRDRDQDVAEQTDDGDERDSGEHGSDSHDGGMSGSYWRFAAMIATSTTVMFLLTYTNVWAWDHVRWSEERLYMALIMGSAMAIVMLGFMWSMYEDVRRNVGVVLVALLVGTAGLWLSRSQHFVDDGEYMKAMIPHHSIAILTSERADIGDVRVRELADEIILAQRREIAEMDWLIRDIEENGAVTSEEEASQRPVPEFEAELDPDGEDD